MLFVRFRSPLLSAKLSVFLLLFVILLSNFLWIRKLCHAKGTGFPHLTTYANLSNWSREDCSDLVSGLINDGIFLKPVRLPNRCPKLAALNEESRHVGCFYYERAHPPLRLVFYNDTLRNSPDHCVRTCRWAGLTFAGLAEGSLCYCDRRLPVFMLPSLLCGTVACPGDPSAMTCGGETAIDVFTIGVVGSPILASSLATVAPVVPLSRLSSISSEEFDNVKIVYVLVFTGRSWRHVQRMFRLLYHTSNYFYIHVDLKSDYLYSRCQSLAKLFPNNVHVASNRQNPVWGAPSLLDLLLSILEDLFYNFPHWKWDFFINLSETDLPVMPVETLVRLLDSHRGRIFVKQTAEEIFKYIHSEGLQYAFVQCGNYVWRAGVRPPLDGVVIHGGSDWLVLPRDFAFYTVFGNDDLVRGLRIWFQNAILPVESFFHTLAYNSHFCERVINANFRLTNWQRPQGCSCKKTTVADWCGCSPSVFSGPQALLRLHEALNVADSPMAFGRKFDSTIDVAMVNYVEGRLLGRKLPSDENIDLYLESIFSSEFDGKREPLHVRNGINNLIKVACEFVKPLETNCCSHHAFGANDLPSQQVDVFALFNATETLGGLNYTHLGIQLDHNGFLPREVVGSTLPLRLLHPPNLVLRLPFVEVLFRPNYTSTQAWISPRPLEILSPAELFYFEIGFGFDVKELVFRNYHRFTPSSQDAAPLTLLAIWRDSKESVTPLKVRLFKSEMESAACDFTVPRSILKDAPYPGLPGFRASFIELDLVRCANGRSGGVWKIAVEDKWASFGMGQVEKTIWKVADICGAWVGTQCSKKVWSSVRIDRKSTLGQFDAATGSLQLGESCANLLDIPI
ncbi:xylosyltransferase [Echinococcus multilocularis]|uniref:protein xylosyltransferase n=1 Tax=Echinococcus multilocularis TaxID=6211 RepID=A0A068YA82_ECHMU|nr:xylosyltransferase [Echinococcus multilocularis]